MQKYIMQTYKMALVATVILLIFKSWNKSFSWEYINLKDFRVLGFKGFEGIRVLKVLKILYEGFEGTIIKLLLLFKPFY